MPSDSNQHPPTIGPDHQLAAPPEEKPRNKTVRVVVWILLLLIFAIAFYLILHQHNQATTASRRGAAGGTVTITSITAKQGDIGVYIDAIGTVTPVYTSAITSQVNGIVTQVYYKEGQIVRRGQPLIDIDSRPYRATLLQAQGILERDQGILAQSTMDLQRYRDAWARNAIPKQTLDDQEKIVMQNQGTVKNDEGTVQFDQIQVAFCHIVAPITGRVGLRLVDPGNVVQSGGGTTLAVVTQIQPITIIFTIPQDNIGQVQPRMLKNAKLEVDAYDRAAEKKIASGTLISLDNQIDTTTGTVKARASFVNRDLSLYPTQFVNTRLLVNTLHNATLIPSDVIQHNGDESFVYVVQNKVAYIKNITLGVTDRDTTQVQGINPGDVVASSSFDKLQDKTKVSITTRQVPAAKASGSEAP